MCVCEALENRIGISWLSRETCPLLLLCFTGLFLCPLLPLSLLVLFHLFSVFCVFFLQDHYHRRAIAVSFWAAFGAPKAGKGNRNCVLMALASLLVGQLERVFGSVVIA